MLVGWGGESGANNNKIIAHENVQVHQGHDYGGPGLVVGRLTGRNKMQVRCETHL